MKRVEPGLRTLTFNIYSVEYSHLDSAQLCVTTDDMSFSTDYILLGSVDLDIDVPDVNTDAAFIENQKRAIRMIEAQKELDIERHQNLIRQRLALPFDASHLSDLPF